jgi:hypothetical protein
MLKIQIQYQKYENQDFGDAAGSDSNLCNFNGVRVRILAQSQYDARQLIQVQYGDAAILFGPVRVDLTRAV